MKTLLFLLLALTVISCSSEIDTTQLKYDEKGKKHSLPKVNIIIDGSPEEWNNQGSEVKLYSDYMGVVPSANDFEASFKMGWNDSAFCVMVSVNDDTLFSESKSAVDAVEIFLIDKVGGKNLVQYILNPDFSKDSISTNIVCWDHRGSRKVAGKPMTIKAATKKTSKGYCMEAFIPFSNIDITANEGEEAGFEIMVRDADHQNDKSFILAWNYLKDAYLNNFALNRVLFTSASEKIESIIKSYVLDRDSAFFITYAPSEWAGKKMIVKDDSSVLFEGVLMKEENVAKGIFKMALKKPYVPTAVFIDTLLTGVIDLNIANREFLLKKINPHENYVNLLLRKQQLQPAPANPVLFIGHSMFRFWHTFEDDMEGYTAINRAFGGSQSAQVLFYFDQLILPYKPKAIVYFEGANDYRTGITANQFFENVKTFAMKVKDSLPGTKLFILSPDTRHEFPEFNKPVKEFISKNSDFMTYIDISNFKKNLGEKYEDILLPDRGHWNSKGYTILAPIIREKIKAFKN